MISNIQKSLKKTSQGHKKTYEDNDNLFSDDENENEDQEMREDDKGKGNNNKKAKSKNLLLKEDNDEDIIDLLDPSGAKNSLCTFFLMSIVRRTEF